MQQHGIEIPMKNIADSSEFRKDLLSIAGSSQTPCLVIDGKPMHESEDIIKWFKDYL
jgi:glutaredoxin 3